ncbi:hypothetical protein THAOC_09281 [Thalassiosira oceanica]|uniref:Translation initiation factor eIF2B subunit epsilon n=1 Tax=Thalassiosira oceanica TaxID=159749 RepID=K0SVI3_THAOC|nr:hypothetical protein THAOC_09281 [Thalassiosira oceanica]|eukprot:EJK69460.1 hypothetical protein THAOC_09281 [Thalassiosira oceanica]
MGKSDPSDPSDSKHEQKLQAVLLADSFDRAWDPVTSEAHPSSSSSRDDGPSSCAAPDRGRERPLVLCPLNGVPLLRHSVDFLQGSGVEELFVLCGRGVDAVEDYLRSCAPGIREDGRGGKAEDGHDKDGGVRRRDSAGAAGGSRIVWSSKMTITTMRFTDCTNAGDALRELDRRNVVKSDPFILMQGDAVTNADLRGAMAGHKARKKRDSSAIMTILLHEVGGWGLDDRDPKGEEGGGDGSANPNAPGYAVRPDHRLPSLRGPDDDLLLALDRTHSDRILLWDSSPSKTSASVPAVFFAENSSSIVLTRDHLDVGVDLCSPDVLARFSDEFDYRRLRSQFVSNSVSEEESGLQSRIHAHIIVRGEYAGRVGDMRRYHAVSMDLLRRWCYPLVPDGYGRMGPGAAGTCYAVDRNLVYRAECGGSEVGRSTVLSGPLLLGPRCTVGGGCHLRRSVLGPGCNVGDGCRLVDCHLWGDVTVGDGAVLDGAVVCEGAVIGRNAVLRRGCVVGRDCKVGEGVVLDEFTRITLAPEADDGDDYSGFLSESESESSSDSDGSEDSDDEGDAEAGKGAVQVVNAQDVGDGAASAARAMTDTDVVGPDGLGRVWTPPVPDDYDSDDPDEAEEARAASLELARARSIGYDTSLLYRRWEGGQFGADDDADDGFSLDDASDGHADDGDGGWGEDGTSADHDHQARDASANLDGDGMIITGRQRGVDVVRELRDICLEHETSQPVELLRIELNSFKFSQNATYADCCRGAILSVVDRVLADDPSPGPATLARLLRVHMEYWKALFGLICMGPEEEGAVIRALESAGTSGTGAASAALSAEPAFRFALQTLNDMDVVGDAAILSWAEERRGETDDDGPVGRLFRQKHTQDFLEWLEEDSDDDDEDSSSGDGSDGSSDSDSD